MLIPNDIEELTLRAAIRLGDDAYGVSIRREIEQMTGKAPSYGALYAALERLHDAGYIAYTEGPATPDRGGRPKRLVHVDGSALRALDAKAEAYGRRLLPQPSTLTLVGGA